MNFAQRCKAAFQEWVDTKPKVDDHGITLGEYRAHLSLVPDNGPTLVIEIPFAIRSKQSRYCGCYQGVTLTEQEALALADYAHHVFDEEP